MALMAWCFAAGWAFHHYMGTDGGDGAPPSATRLAQLGEERAMGDVVTSVGDPNLEPVSLFWEVLNNIRRAYYKPITDEDERVLAYGAAKGLTRALGDPYSDFMEPLYVKEFITDAEGVMEGIGAELISEVDEPTGQRRVLVHKPLRGSPAAAAGLLPGDLLLLVDEEQVLDVSVDQVAMLIRGERGTDVTLTIFREGADEPLKITITRARIELPVVDFRMLTDKVGYLHIEQFNEQTVRKTLEALDALDEQGMEGLVFDLRDNKGGVLDFAVDIGSLFIKDTPILWVEERGSEAAPMMAEPGLYRGPPGPVAVLVNGRSASAAEIVAGALQDTEIAKLVGTRSFGKGLVQTVVPLHDPSVRLKLTTAKWLTTNKRFINRDLPAVRRLLMPDDGADEDEDNRGGLEPDIEVEIAEDLDTDRMLDRLADEDDAQLQAAIKHVTDSL